MNDEQQDKISTAIEEFHENLIDALRRSGVAERKLQGLEIETVESVRLFRSCIGYINRLSALRKDLMLEISQAETYHVKRVLGHVDDYNRILEDLRDHPNFKEAISSYNGASYRVPQENETETFGYWVEIEGHRSFVTDRYEPRSAFGTVSYSSNVPMKGSVVENFVYPRLLRVAKDVEYSLMGRCSSGKRPFDDRDE